MSKEPRVSGSIVKVEPSRESAMYVMVTVSFRNLTSEALGVAKYEVVWRDGRREGEGPKFIAPGETLDFRIKMDWRHGSLDMLSADPGAAQVRVLKTNAFDIGSGDTKVSFVALLTNQERFVLLDV